MEDKPRLSVWTLWRRGCHNRGLALFVERYHRLPNTNNSGAILEGGCAFVATGKRARIGALYSLAGWSLPCAAPADLAFLVPDEFLEVATEFELGLLW
jgi:hypothetical protein